MPEAAEPAPEAPAAPRVDAEEMARRAVRRRWLLNLPAILWLILFAAGPLLVVLLYSFLAAGDYGGVRWELSTDGWFAVLMTRDIFDDTLRLQDAHLAIFWRSVKLSVMTTLACLLLGFPTAYFIATRSRANRNLWLFLITIPFWTNLLIRTFAMLEWIRAQGVINSVLTGLGIVDEPVQMLYTDFSIMLGMTYVYFPLMVLPLYASMEKLDFRLVEAAYDLYASRLQVLRGVIVPLVSPGIVAGSILVFIPSLGAYVTPRVLGGGKQMMLGNLIELQFGQGRNWPLGAALSISLLALVMVALIFYVRAAQKGGEGHG
ncbi:ABC transporter permease [Paralimibaculum aggregatum]|uniref:ABC transporter permease n=2 Tax=Paralimibaculum aggregatum TaxID=3036245 RepID=A0ABQ6LQQ3_9RHOB|nr:ABC transporter permease [Limibaculum sp. NKW23]